MKNPNGYGSVFKLGGNRRKPWCARVTIGWTEEGKQKYKNIGYYEEREEAMIALAQYNSDPYDLDNNKITFEEIYEKWSEEKFPKISKSNIVSYQVSFRKCAFLHKMKFKQIRKMHMQRIINENEHLSYQVRMKIKTLFLQLYKWALENDIVHKNYAQFIDIGEVSTRVTRTPFTQNEIEMLWNSLDEPFVDTLVIMIYTGMRIGELLEIKISDINIDERILIGGFKTKAGTDRTIPIHHKILPIIESKMNQKYLIEHRGKQLVYKSYIRHFKALMNKFGMEHLPHDCRHTTATLMHRAEINTTIVKKILGHSSKDVTEKIYTHVSNEQLVDAINRI